MAVETKVRHPLYGKIMRRTTKFKAHDEANSAGEGDVVDVAGHGGVRCKDKVGVIGRRDDVLGIGTVSGYCCTGSRTNVRC